MDAYAAHGLNLRLNRWILAPALGLMVFVLGAAVPAQAQTSTTAQSSSEGPVAHGTIATAAPVTYDNRYEVYGGLNYMNFTAGPFAIPRTSLGGGEIMGTYWLKSLTHRVPPGLLGVVADVRGEYGTTQIGPVPVTSGLHRTMVFQHMVMGGLQIRGPRNQFFALGAHALGGRSWGNFSHGTLPARTPESVGLYTDHSAPIAAIGASLDINQSKNFAIRISPDLMLSSFGPATDTNFALSGGIIYRFGK